MPKRARTGNTLRLIGGELRRRQLRFPDAEGLRPTGDRVRETLFNWLQDYCAGANCLDLFAGSGVLGMEAISRGAAWLDLVDSNGAVVQAVRGNLDSFGITNARVSQARAQDWLAAEHERKYQLVFLDPPFASADWSAICRQLERSGLLDDNCLLYLESDAPIDQDSLPANWREHRSSKAGQVYYYLFRREAGTSQ